LLKSTVSNSEYIVPNNWMKVNEEWEGMWKAAIAVQFEVLYQYIPGGSEENQRKLQQG
jgi:hypothetical protein